MPCKKLCNKNVKVYAVCAKAKVIANWGWLKLLNCDNVIRYRQPDSYAQWKNLRCWQQPSAGDAHTSRAHPPCRGRGAAPTGLHPRAVLWVPRCCQPALPGHKRSPSSCNLLPFIWEGGNFPCELARCVQWKQVLRVANHCSCRGLLTQAPPGLGDQEVCLASRANSLEEPRFLRTA